MKNPVANTGIAEVIDSTLDILSEIGKIRKRTVDLRIYANIIYPNGRITTYKSLISPDEDFVLVPILSRIWMIDKIYEVNGKRTVFLSNDYHKSVDLSKCLIPILYSGMLRIRMFRKFQYIKLDNVMGSLDLNAFDNKISHDFISDAFKILSTKTLEFLEEIPKKQFMLSIIISALVGVIIGAVATVLGLALLG